MDEASWCLEIGGWPSGCCILPYVGAAETEIILVNSSKLIKLVLTGLGSPIAQFVQSYLEIFHFPKTKKTTLSKATLGDGRILCLRIYDIKSTNFEKRKIWRPILNSKKFLFEVFE